MRCPACGSLQTKVLSTRRPDAWSHARKVAEQLFAPGEPWLGRERACLRCRRRWATIEAPAENFLEAEPSEDE